MNFSHRSKQNSAQRTILPLLTVMLFTHISVNITFPVMTLLFFDAHSRLFSPDTSYAVRSFFYGIGIGLPHLINIVSVSFLSLFSDHFGRKRLLYISAFGIFIFSVISTYGILVGSVITVLVGCMINGIFSRTNAIAQAVVADVAGTERKITYMGYLQLVLAIGACIGPLIGGFSAQNIFFNQINFALPFLITGLFAWIAFLLARFYFQETKPKHATHHTLSHLFIEARALLQKKEVLLISLMLFCFQLSWSLYYQYIPPFIKNQFAFGSHSIGLFIALISVWLSIATLLTIHIFQKNMTLRRLLFYSAYVSLLGLLLTICSVVTPLHSMGKFLLWLGAIPVAAGDVIAYICITTMYSNAVSVYNQGAVMGICLFIVSVTWSLTAFLGGLMSAITPSLPLMVAPVGVLCFLILWRLQCVQGEV
ncbi:MAG: MFS transporter [Pseudomonadota bacterium]|nr:MFS transporter [Gammaproteobacteria bacterium]MBU1558442.1 MFS transporter [Gammaproteobacteria bacterium]MBU1628647.1 MFS transporter [Gammaproteobacteria bacterium]MBU1926314.1 MFS transporter [Gammaproteobacteria bacterium]MBU2546373.1 MFS transporter [Gammaproteobacteria bacterium]